VTDRPERQPALAGRYGPTATVALLALCPNIALTTALPLAQQRVVTALHTSTFGTQLAAGLSNGGYALGAVLAAYLVLRFKQRLLFLATETVFVAGSVAAATATSPAQYVVGRLLQGATTGLMLVIALPPLVTRFGSRVLPRTAALVNIGLFGAVTIGPLLGGVAGESASGWRWLLAVVALAGAAGVVLAALTLEQRPPFDESQPPDWSAFALAAAATFLPFLAVSELSSGGAASPLFGAPLGVGLAALVVLIVRQYRRSNALMPVQALSTSLPVLGIVAAMVGGAAVVALTTLTTAGLLDGQKDSTLVTGALLTPQVLGVAVAAFAFARLFPTRWLPLQVLVGILLTGIAGALLLAPEDHALVLAAAALLGLGAGSTVSPGLFVAAFGVESDKLGRAFALVELLRAEAAYLVGPVVLYAAEQSADPAQGLVRSTWIVIGLVIAGTGLLLLLARLSRVRLRTPDLDGWLEGRGQALPSPPTGAVVREQLSGTHS